MRKTVTLFLILLLLLLSTSLTVAQSYNTVLLAGVDGDSVYIARINERETRSEVVFSGGHDYANLTWDPNLLWFIFTYTDEAGQTNLAVSDNTGAPAYNIAEDIAPLPPSFTAKGDQIVYAVGSGEDEVDVYALEVRSFAGFGETVKIATIPYEMDCDLSSLNGAQKALWKETGGAPDLDISRAILFLSPEGLVHNEGCAASKTFLTDVETGETVEILHNLQWAVPSPDGGMLAGLIDGELVITILGMEYYMIQPTSAPPSYPIAWGDHDHPNSLFYTSRVQNGRRSLDSADEQKVLDIAGEAALGFWNVAIYEYNLVTYTDREVYSQIAYGIGSIRMVSGEALVFSQVAPLRLWVDGLLDGTITDPSDDQAIDVSLYWVDLETRRHERVGQNIRQSAASWNAAFG